MSASAPFATPGLRPGCSGGPVANEARGEVPVTVDGVDLVVAAEMEGLAQLSGRLNCLSLAELQQRVFAAELRAMYAVLECCVVRGDAAAARKAMRIKGALALAGAMQKAFLHHVDEAKSAGNGEGAGATIAA